MLAYILALTVGLGSLAIYMAAFFFPEVHRKNDFIWSGVGLFYAWVLWVCAGRITGGLLLGQVAAVALLVWSITQTLQLRRQLTPLQQQTELPSAEEVKNTVEEKLSNLSSSSREISQLGDRLSSTVTGAKNQIQQRLGALTQRQSKSDAAASTTAPTAVTGEAMPAPSNAAALQSDEDNPRVQVIDNRIPPMTQQPSEPDELVQAARESVQEDAQAGENALAVIESAVTEEEAIALAVETTLSEDSTPTVAVNPEASISEPIRPNPPDPKLVEAAIRDAEEKSEDASPPETVDTAQLNSLKNQDSQKDT